MQLGSRSSFWIASILALVAIVSLQALFDRSHEPLKVAQKKAVITLNEPLVPGIAALKFLSLSDRPMVADLLWLQTIQYFGSGSPYGNYPALGPLLTRITELDPKFEYAYEFGLVVLPFMKQTDTAIALGEKAMVELPNNGLLSFYLASTYQINLKDYRKAAHYYEKAAKEPGAPQAAKHLAGVSLAKLNSNLNDRLVAVEFWKAYYENATTEEEKEMGRNWMEHMLIVYALEEEIVSYKQQFGSYPKELSELVEKGFLNEIPRSPIGRAFSLDSQTGTVSFDRLAE